MNQVRSIDQKIEACIKGALGETLARQLFIFSGYKVYPYGVEHIVPGFSHRIHEDSDDEMKNCEMSRLIMEVPDLMVHDDKNAFMVEAKYRTKEENVKIKSNYRHPKAYFLFFTPSDIKIAHACSKNNIVSIFDDNITTMMVKDENGKEIKLLPFNFEKNAAEACMNILKKVALSFEEEVSVIEN